MDETRWLMFATVEGKIGYLWWLWVAVTKDTVAYSSLQKICNTATKEYAV